MLVSAPRTHATFHPRLSCPRKNNKPKTAINEFIRVILDSMAGFVSLRSILYKITHDHCEDQVTARAHVFPLTHALTYPLIHSPINSLT
jgi:hypothetical protein